MGVCVCAKHHGHLPHYDVTCCSSLTSKNKVADSKIIISMSRYIRPEARCDSREQINLDDFGSFLCPVVFILGWLNSLVTPVLYFGIRTGARLMSPINVTVWKITPFNLLKWIYPFYFSVLQFLLLCLLGGKLFKTTRSDKINQSAVCCLLHFTTAFVYFRKHRWNFPACSFWPIERSLGNAFKDTSSQQLKQMLSRDCIFVSFSWFGPEQTVWCETEKEPKRLKIATMLNV